MIRILTKLVLILLVSSHSLWSSQEKDDQHISPLETLSDQIDRLNKSHSAVDETFLAAHPEIIYIEKLLIPSSVDLVGQDDLRLISERHYEAGDVIFENTSFIFHQDQRLLLNFKGRLILIDNLIHTVNRGNSLREFYYFDSFMNHSCGPNTIMVYLTSNDYQCIALRPIAIGDELTCDYAVFDTQPDGDGFMCECGSPNCRGFMTNH
jgi:hypothetical protein